jgi:hypothetical protein
VKALGVLFCGGFLLVSCGAARNTAVTSYHVATAPVTIVRRQFSDKPPQTASSDVDVPGRPVAVPSPTPAPRTVAETSATPKMNRSQPSTSPRGGTNQSEFPVAKPVPGKSGYVYSPYDSSKYVDVSGYTSGSKVKDPYTQKIFIVP